MNGSSPRPTSGRGHDAPQGETEASIRPSDDRPVFVVGAPRSGTSLLYHLLMRSRAFPEYMAESKVMPCEERYGPLSRPRNRDRFLRDFLESRQFARSHLAAADFGEEARRSCTGYADVLRLLMDGIARAQGKSRWVEKTPSHLRYIHRLAEAFPTAKFVHIIRDGRDVALSLRKLGWTHGFRGNPLLQLVEGAKLWEGNVLEGRRAGRRLGERYLEVRYEDLVTDHEAAMERLTGFAEIGSETESIGSDHADSLESANTAFSSRMEGVSDEAVGRWRRRLKEEERGALDYAIGDTLAELGYPLEGDGAAPGAAARLFTTVCPAVERLRTLAKTRTALRRWSASPLEIGLE